MELPHRGAVLKSHPFKILQVKSHSVMRKGRTYIFVHKILAPGAAVFLLESSKSFSH